MLRQEELWAGDIGSRYADTSMRTVPETDRHWWPMVHQAHSQIWARTLTHVDRTLPVLEVGCGVGNNLDVLAHMGFKNLCGVDINARAVQLCRARGFPAVTAEADALPFANDAFGLVVTDLLLIHIPAEKRAAVQQELARVSRQYVAGYEYYSDPPTSRASFMGGLVPEGVPEFTFKAPFCESFLQNAPALKLTRRELIIHVDGSGNTDEAYLLTKGK